MFTTKLPKTISGHIHRLDLRQHKRERKTVGKPMD
jgi:acyl-coenzyme A synthetase/AMP-(fatty) acid ligase